MLAFPPPFTQPSPLMPAKRNRVYYCDDQQNFIDTFTASHADEFEIHSSLDISRAKADVQKLIEQGKCPDIILLDLFHPKAGPDFEARRDLAKRKLEELTAKIKEIHPFIEAAWRAEGIEALKELRTLRTLDHVPILFYTQRGLVFLSEKELVEIYKNDSDWMLKDSDFSSPITERARINQMVTRYHLANRKALTFAKGAAISIASVVATTIIGAFLQNPVVALRDWLAGLLG